jgi:hypothetical protein
MTKSHPHDVNHPAHANQYVDPPHSNKQRYHAHGLQFVQRTWHANWNPNFGQLTWAIVEKTNLPPWLHAPTVSQIVLNFTHSNTSIGKSKHEYVNRLPEVKLKK